MASALEDPENLAGLIKTMARPDDLVVCLGAGSITNWAQALPIELAGDGSEPKEGRS